MSAGIVHGLRLIRVLCSLSRHGALFPLQSFGAPAWLVRTLRLVERRRETERPGERLATALQTLGQP